MTSGVPARCDVWWASTTSSQDDWSVLDAGERKGCRRMRRVEDRCRCLTGRTLTRTLLAHRIGCSPESLVLDRTCERCGSDHGKPRLVTPRRPVAFNVAHAGDHVVVALTDGAPVGVDVEECAVRDGGRRELSEHVLAPAELAVYRSLPARDRGRALAVWWTRKEAVLKAMGAGLAVPPSDVVVTPPGQLPAVLDSPAPWPSLVMRDLSPAPGYVGCVAVLGATSMDVNEHRATRPLPAGAP